MIIRILAEGQFDVPDDTVDGLNELDGQLEAAVESADEQAMAAGARRASRPSPGVRKRGGRRLSRPV